jgi:transcriptional regulator with GAF, ATPase, and Fis domain/tetratricopeptide (TPR) repeat protein
MSPAKKTSLQHNGHDAFLIEKNLAQRALSSGNRETAWMQLSALSRKLADAPENPETDAMFASTAIELANVSFLLGKGFSELTDILQKALGAVDRIGDRRSLALIHLHLGRLYYFGQKRDMAMAMFLSGKSEAEALGDDDIMTQSAEFIGLYYFIQGRFREAILYFERAAQSFETQKHGQVINPSGPLWLSYCSAFLGQFHRAIGTLDYYRRVALEGGDPNLSTTLRAVLGIILLGIKKNREAYFHLSGAYQEARRTQNALAGYFAKGGLGMHHFLEGRLKEAQEWIRQIVEEGQSSGLIRQYASPIVIEMLFELYRKNLRSITEINYPEEFQRIMSEPNIHLRGVAWRLRAMDGMDKGEDKKHIEADLKRSEDLLTQSGDPIQLGKTRLETARMKLRSGDAEHARSIAEKARKDFGSYVDVFFPDDLRPLLTLRSDLTPFFLNSDENLLGMFADVISDLTPSTDFESLLSRTVKATNRFFGAERGGIFWFKRGGSQKGPLLRAPCNLSQKDIGDPDFKPNLSLIFKAFHENQPQVMRRDDFALNPSRVKAMLCVPFQVEGYVRGVLYHDNSYVRDCFDNFSTPQLVQMARWLTSYIDHIFEFSRRLEQKVADQSVQPDIEDSFNMVTENTHMRHLLQQAERIAASDSTVLILGETGVGKELLARRIHQKSPRKNHPLVIVDPTVIPENLVESELFGYEKGAFTGADRQKKGRLELAHNGTLFIDEIGEIPRSIQVKLLRAIQEKSMVRIGGTTTIYSDFRLVAATNRDLAQEVADGRFREDLFYRLNVIPMTLPALRDRREDIPILAGHFLQRYSLKYNRQGLAIKPSDEAMLKSYSWPGNIRELKNVIERAVLLSSGGELHLDLPFAKSPAAKNPFDDLPSLDELQRRYILYVMKKTGGKMSGPGGAAELLKMKRTSLYNRMQKLGMRKSVNG